MSLVRILLSAVLIASVSSLAQEPTDKPAGQDRQRNADRNREAGESSSRDTRIDLSPPKDDAKNHPNSSIPSDEAAEESDVQEFHPW